jgi:hypothetical protein
MRLLCVSCSKEANGDHFSGTPSARRDPRRVVTICARSADAAERKRVTDPRQPVPTLWGLANADGGGGQPAAGLTQIAISRLPTCLGPGAVEIPPRSRGPVVPVSGSAGTGAGREGQS